MRAVFSVDEIIDSHSSLERIDLQSLVRDGRISSRV